MSFSKVKMLFTFSEYHMMFKKYLAKKKASSALNEAFLFLRNDLLTNFSINPGSLHQAFFIVFDASFFAQAFEVGTI